MKQPGIFNVPQVKNLPLDLHRLANFPRFNPNPVLELSATGAINYFNDATEVMAGELGREHPAQMLPPDAAAIVRECLGSGTPKLRVETPVGSRVLSWSFFPVPLSKTVHCYGGDITERKREEEALRLQNAALEATANAIVFTDPSGNVLWINAAFTALTGYTAQETLGKNPRLLKSGQQDEAFYRNLWLTISSGQVWRGELTNRRKDGSLYEEEMTITPLRNAEGAITRYIAIKQDISGRKRAEEALQASKQIMDGIINAIPVRVFWKDKNLIYQGCNAVFARDAGFADPKDIIGKNDNQMGWRAQAEKYRGDDHQVIESGCSKLLIEEPQTTPEGKTITLLSSKIPLRGSGGEISGVIGTYLDITARKQAEEALRQSEEQLRAMFELASVGLAQADPRTGQWLRVNKKMCEITGYSAGELLQLHVEDITHPEDRNSDWAAFQRVVRGEAPDYRMEKRYLRKDGAIAWVSVNMTIMRDAAGQPIRTLAMIEDITERKRVEEELQWKTAFLEAQVNSSIDGIIVVDQHRKMSLLNQRLIDLFKMPRHIAERGSNENRLQWVADVVKNSEPFVQKVLSLYARPNEISHDEIELKDGTILDRYTSPANGKDGKYYGRIWTYRDITARKRAEEALRKTKLQLAHAMSLAQLVAWEYDVASGLFTFSDSYYALHGTTAQLENGNQMSAEAFARKFLHPEDAHLVADAIGNAVATTDPDYHRQQEARIFRRDGELRHVLVHISITKDAAGRTIQIHGANQDITERKRAQVELEHLHKQLMESSRLAGMSEIATNVLHNVGNALNSVNVSTDLIVDCVKNSKASSLARVVALLREHAPDLGAFLTKDPNGRHVPDHLARLSEHLMAEEAKIAGELDSLRRNVEHIKEIVAMQQSYATVGGVTEMTDLAGLVEDSLRLNEGSLNRHGVEIVRELEKAPLMNAEKHKILQILVNLVRNAKYACDESPRADKRLTVRLANGDGRVKISVLDNGVGIPPENLTRIFNYGFTTRKGGHGFGLHGSALAAREMGGSLTVCSGGLGQGAAFTLELPCPTLEKT